MNTFVISLLPVTIVMAVVGQATGSGGSDSLTGIVGLVGQLGISAIFIWLYFNERKERQTTQATLFTFLEKFGALIPEAANTLNEVKRSMDGQVDRMSDPIHRMERAIEELDTVTRRQRQ